MAEPDEQRQQEQQRQAEAEQAKKEIGGGFKEWLGRLEKKVGEATGSARIEARGYLREAQGRVQQGKTTQSNKRSSPETVDDLVKTPEEKGPVIP